MVVIVVNIVENKNLYLNVEFLHYVRIDWDKTHEVSNDFLDMVNVGV